MEQLGQFLLPVAFFAIFYFLVIRPQSKRTKEHRAMVNALTVGSEVIFAGGLMGRIKKIEGFQSVGICKINDCRSPSCY